MFLFLEKKGEMSIQPDNWYFYLYEIISNNIINVIYTKLGSTKYFNVYIVYVLILNQLYSSLELTKL